MSDRRRNSPRVPNSPSPRSLANDSSCEFARRNKEIKIAARRAPESSIRVAVANYRGEKYIVSAFSVYVVNPFTHPAVLKIELSVS